MLILWICAIDQQYPIFNWGLPPTVQCMGSSSTSFTQFNLAPSTTESQKKTKSYSCPSCCQYLKRKVKEEPEYTNIVSCLCNTSSLILSIISLLK